MEALPRARGPLCALLFALMFAVLISHVHPVAAKETPDTDDSDAFQCPTTDPKWTSSSGVPGGIVTKIGEKTRSQDTKSGKKGEEWKNDTISEMGYFGAGWGFGAAGVPDAGTCYTLCQTFSFLSAFNDVEQRCSYWTWSGKTGDCWLFDCTACRRKKSFKGPEKAKFKKSVSGAGPQSCGSDPDVTGDPHFTGADSSHFDFSGVPNTTYCLVSDSHLHINAYFGGRYGEYQGNPQKSLTWIRKLGILWGHHTISLSAREGDRWQYDNGYLDTIEVDGERVELPSMGSVASFHDDSIIIEWLSAKERSAEDDIDVYVVKIPGVLEVLVKLRPEVSHMRTSTDGTVHFDLEFKSLSVSHNAHGVLGQTYRLDHQGKLAEQQLQYSELFKHDVVPGDNAEGFISGVIDDYKTSNLLKTDCKVSRFARFHDLDTETTQIMEFISKSTHILSSVGGESRKMLRGAVDSVSLVQRFLRRRLK